MFFLMFSNFHLFPFYTDNVPNHDPKTQVHTELLILCYTRNPNYCTVLYPDYLLCLYDGPVCGTGVKQCSSNYTKHLCIT